MKTKKYYLQVRKRNDRFSEIQQLSIVDEEGLFQFSDAQYFKLQEKKKEKNER